MQVTDANGYIYGPNGLQVNGSDGKPKVLSTGGSSGIPHGTASGTDTYSVSITGVTSYSDGDSYLVRFTNGNTTGSTLNINSLGAITLYRNNDGQLIGGDIQSGAEMLCVYNSSLNVFQVIGTSPNTLLAYVTNSESITITKGQPVYAFGGQGDRLKVKLAYNTSDATSAQTVGLVLSTSIGANQKGFIILNGQLDGLSILPTSTWADGDPVYLGATAGTITNVKPSAPNHLVYLGFVTTANNGSAGRMYVRVQNGYEMDELHDVQISGLADNDLLQYDLATDLWQNKSLSGAGIQPTLVSGTNIKTVNSNSLLGSGDITVQPTLVSGTSIKTVNSTSLLGSGDIAVQPTLVSGTNIKTVNGNSLLGSGDVTISGGGNVGVHAILPLASGQACSAIIAGIPLSSSGTIINRLYALPFIPNQNITTSGLFINVNTGLAGGLARILIFSNLNGLPNTKLYESANLDCSTTGIKTATTTFNFVAGTTYWLAFHSNNNLANITFFTNQGLLPIGINSSTFVSTYVWATPTFGSVPSTFPTVTYQAGTLPYIGITKA